MPEEDRIEKLRRELRAEASAGLKREHVFPVPPRKAMSKARKASKKSPYPLPPYPGVGLLELARWARSGWAQLGRWQGLALPLVVITALLTWEQEKALQEARWVQAEKAELKHMAAEMYGAFGPPRKKRKLLGIIPVGRRR